jgi:hypothetical protein
LAGADVAVAPCSGAVVGAAVLAQAAAAMPAAATVERRRNSLRVTFFITFLLRNVLLKARLERRSGFRQSIPLSRPKRGHIQLLRVAQI